MKKLKQSLAILSLIAIACVPGCKSNDNQALLNDQVLKLQEQVNSLEKSNEVLQLEVTQITKLLEEIDMKVSDNESLTGTDEVHIYMANTETYEKEKAGIVDVTSDMNIQEKVQHVADMLSQEAFDGLPIVVEEIKIIDGKAIAVVNLQDDHDKSWSSVYFQGSAGGTITKESIVETLLQRDYTGEWIDGIVLVYNGNEEEFDHIKLVGWQEIYYR